MLDFSVLPPEVNSAMMYTGPGPGPMLAAAAAWEGLATSLTDSSIQTSALLGDLASEWQGPSAVLMADKTTQHVAWLNQTAMTAHDTAAQANAAVVAYTTAFAGTVPPPVIAENRAQLMALIATNFLGINTAAIMATEAQYMEMWAQDATAMFGYAGASAQATMLPPFGPTTTATSTPALAVTNPIPANIQSVLSALGAPTTVWGLAKDLSSFTANSINGTSIAGWSSLAYTTSKDAKAADKKPDEKPIAVVPVQPVPQRLQGLAAGGSVTRPVTASLGNAGAAGRLSVPVSWSTQTSTLTGQVKPLGTPEAVAAEPVVGSPGMGGMPFASATGSSRYAPQPRYGKTLTVMRTKGI